MKQRTPKNLVTAMQGEAFAYIKYMLFAEIRGGEMGHHAANKAELIQLNLVSER
jgi:hypothetical protein